MCLDPRFNYAKPYNKTTFRYKWARVAGRVWISDQYRRCFEAPYQHDKYHRKAWNTSPETGDVTTDGFHVYNVKRDAQGAWNARFPKEFALFRVECRGFLASGTFGGKHCETYRKIRFLNRVK